MIDFVGKRKLYICITSAVIAVSIIAMFVFGVRLDIQFKGGSIITYSFTGDVDKAAFQTAAEAALGEKVSIQEKNDAITGQKNYVVALTADKGISSEKQLALSTSLEEIFKDNDIQPVSIHVVDPTIGREFLLKCIVAVGFASILMVIYIGFRFKKISGWSAGVMAVVALLHDIFVIFATFVIFRIPINDNFIAVVLTILGYSLNDTIVIYDRIRENKRLYGSKLSVSELVNKSLNQSLARSMATSFTTITAMTVVSIVAVIFRVDSILSFSFPLIIGMISGVYSSICIAGPLWVWWEERKLAKKTA